MPQHGNALDGAAARELAAILRVEVITPSDTSYDAARAVWNGLVDRRPSAIAYCANVDDIAVCVQFARERELLTAVRAAATHAPAPRHATAAW